LLQNPDDLAAALFGDQPPPCFYCTETLTLPAVHWMGASGNILLHPNCVCRLFMRLAVDLYVLERAERLP
jgi:hypothetical protein